MTNTTNAPLTTTTIVLGDRPRPPRRGPEHSVVSRVASTFILTIGAIYFLIPIWWLFVSATKSTPELFTTNGFWFGEWNLWENVTSVLTRNDGEFFIWMANSVLYAAGGGAAATLLGAAAGYAIAKFEFRGRGFIFALIIGGVLLPGALLTIPLFLLFSALGLVNSYWAVLVPSMVSPFAVYLSRIYASASIPDELLEAARVDGAGELRIFFTMSLRIMSPALVTVFLFSFVGVWNNFFLPLVMLKDATLFPVTLGIYNWFKAFSAPRYDDVLTGSLLSVVPLIIAFVLLQRFWRAGLTAGAVKA